MERQTETTQRAGTPDTPVKRFRFYAVLHNRPKDGETKTVTVEADKKRGLFEEIGKWPEAEVVAIYKGRQLQFQEKRQLTLV